MFPLGLPVGFYTKSGEVTFGFPLEREVREEGGRISRSCNPIGFFLGDCGRQHGFVGSQCIRSLVGSHGLEQSPWVIDPLRWQDWLLFAVK